MPEAYPYVKEEPTVPGRYWALGGPAHHSLYERMICLFPCDFVGGQKLKLTLGEKADFYAGPIPRPKRPGVRTAVSGGKGEIENGGTDTF